MKQSKVYNVALIVLRCIYNFIFDTVFPPLCAYCKNTMKTRTVFCQDCLSYVDPVVTTVLEVTKTKKVKVFAVSGYKDPLRSLILSKNYSDIVSSRQLGELIWDMTYLKNVSFDVIVPIPLHWTRFSKRGFNQAQQMANVISKKSGKPVVQLVKRIKKTKFQASLQKNMREKNVKNAMTLVVSDLQGYKNKTILLVDDLMTTGSTLRVAARELYKLKPLSIIAAVGCRVV